LQVGHTVGAGNFEAAHQLLDRKSGDGPAEDGRIVAEKHALDIRDHPDAEDHASADRVVRAIGGEGGDLEEGAVRVECQMHPLADGHLAPLPEPLVGAFAATGCGLVRQVVDLLEQPEHVSPVALELFGPGVEAGRQGPHGVHPPARRRGWSNARKLAAGQL
jgi:hypothetical protein